MPHIIELRRGTGSLRLAPRLGGRATSLRLDAGHGARDVLAPFPEDATQLLRWPKGGIYPLLPYGNRIRDARLDAWNVTLRPHPDGAPHTLHGPAHRAIWTAHAHDAATAILNLDRPADDEWPWHFEGELRFDLAAPDRLFIAIALTNRDATPMPAGIGLHPYFTTAPDALISAEAPLDWPFAPDGLAGPSRPAPSPRGTLPAGDLTLYRSEWNGLAEAGLPGGGRLVLRRLSGPLDHLVIHRPATNPYLCLEPMSHVADAFNLAVRSVPGTGAATLQPGERMEGSVEIALTA
ncbi:hypothetical protein ACE7GA_14185 [Roseomonas sp. CCTCC AB2023176]|uniref:aldose epimerase family protein n=1 Tax=Roseomonas sp. CCTCC AB2023176 TaxID=3342640 RepID=UPI0035D69BA8